MKVLFSQDVLMKAVGGAMGDRDISVLLNCCQDGKIRGFACNHSIMALSAVLDREDFSQCISILTCLLELIDVSCYEIRLALKCDDFEAGLDQIVARRHRLDCIVTQRQITAINSKIKVCDPAQLRRELEDGKTSQQRRDL